MIAVRSWRRLIVSVSVSALRAGAHGGAERLAKGILVAAGERIVERVDRLVLGGLLVLSAGLAGFFSGCRREPESEGHIFWFHGSASLWSGVRQSHLVSVPRPSATVGSPSSLQSFARFALKPALSSIAMMFPTCWRRPRVLPSRRFCSAPSPRSSFRSGRNSTQTAYSAHAASARSARAAQTTVQTNDWGTYITRLPYAGGGARSEVAPGVSSGGSGSRSPPPAKQALKESTTASTFAGTTPSRTSATGRFALPLATSSANCSALMASGTNGASTATSQANTAAEWAVSARSCAVHPVT